MTKSSSKNKQHIPRGNKHANNQGIINFYTHKAFPTLAKHESDDEEGEVKKNDTTSIPVKIDQGAGEGKTNLTKFEVPKIYHFDNNVERVLSAIMTIDTKVMNHVSNLTGIEKIRRRMKYIEMICFENAQQEYEEALDYAKSEVLMRYSSALVQASNTNNINCASFELDEATHQELLDNPVSFNEWVSKAADQLSAEEVQFWGHQTAARTALMKWEYYTMFFFNQLNVIIFGKKSHRAKELQLEYMQYGMRKPFGATVAQCFRRVDMMVNLLQFFPPITTRDEMPDMDDWNSAQETRDVTNLMNRRIKFNLLPEKFQNSLEEDTDDDWRTMVYPKFVALVQQCETKDERERKEMMANREKLKASALKRKDDGLEGLDRASKSKNQANKRHKNNNNKNYKGDAQYCALCKAAGAPVWLYKNHATKDCMKADEYKRKLSGGAASQSNVKQDYKKELRKSEAMLNKLKKQTRELKTMMKSSKRKKNDDDMSIDSAPSDETDTSY